MGLRATDIAADERGLILGWFGKIFIGFVLVGIMIFDGGSILVNFFTLDSTADEIAIELTNNNDSGQLRLDLLQPRAEELAKAAGARLVDLKLEGNIVKVTLRRRASTLVVGRIGLIEDWARATVEGQHGSG